jgi:hypothetical protein
MVLLASKYDQSRFFKATDLAAEKRLKIKSVTEEEVGIGKDKEQKLCVWFTTDNHGLVMNRTNIRTLVGAYGDDTAGWVGRIIVVYPTSAEFRGQMKPALRVRIPPPKSNGGQPLQAKPAAPPTAPEIDPADDVDPDLNDEIDI